MHSHSIPISLPFRFSWLFQNRNKLCSSTFINVPALFQQLTSVANCGGGFGVGMSSPNVTRYSTAASSTAAAAASYVSTFRQQQQRRRQQVRSANQNSIRCSDGWILTRKNRELIWSFAIAADSVDPSWLNSRAHTVHQIWVKVFWLYCKIFNLSPATGVDWLESWIVKSESADSILPTLIGLSSNYQRIIIPNI